MRQRAGGTDCLKTLGMLDEVGDIDDMTVPFHGMADLSLARDKRGRNTPTLGHPPYQSRHSDGHSTVSQGQRGESAIGLVAIRSKTRRDKKGYGQRRQKQGLGLKGAADRCSQDK